MTKSILLIEVTFKKFIHCFPYSNFLGLTCRCTECGARRDSCEVNGGKCYTIVRRKVNTTEPAVYSYGLVN